MYFVTLEVALKYRIFHSYSKCGWIGTHAREYGFTSNLFNIMPIFFRKELNDNLPKQMQAVMRVNVLSVVD